MNRHAVTIRRARAGDAVAFPEIEQSAGLLFATLPDLAWVAEDANRGVATYRTLIDAGYCWVAVDAAGQSSGFIAAEPMGDILHICECAVALARQRQGIGTALIQTAIDAAMPFEAITLTTFADVAWNAPYYERLGFRRLAPARLSPELRAILAREAQAGLPIDRRCAMRLDLASSGA